MQARSTSPKNLQSKNYKPHKKTARIQFKRSRTEVTIKPADKNLGIVLMNTDDCILQCVTLYPLSHKQNVYKLYTQKCTNTDN